jgi:hypothetical protein
MSCNASSRFHANDGAVATASAAKPSGRYRCVRRRATGGTSPVPRDWHHQLLAGVIAPLTTATSRLISVSDRVLRGNVASGINAAAGQVARSRPGLADQAWEAARALFASPWLAGEPSPPVSASASDSSIAVCAARRSRGIPAEVARQGFSRTTKTCPTRCSRPLMRWLMAEGDVQPFGGGVEAAEFDHRREGGQLLTVEHHIRDANPCVQSLATARLRDVSTRGFHGAPHR